MNDLIPIWMSAFMFILLSEQANACDYIVLILMTTFNIHKVRI